MELVNILGKIIEEKGYQYQIIPQRDHFLIEITKTTARIKINSDLNVFWTDWEGIHWTRTSSPTPKFEYIGNLNTPEGTEALEKKIQSLSPPKATSPKPDKPNVVKRKYS